MSFKTLIYEGSVKKVYRDTTQPLVNYFEFTDDYSIFDWGKMPDTLAHKGKSLSLMGGYFFNQLSIPARWQGLPQQPTLQRFDAGFRDTLFQSNSYRRLCQAGLNHHFLGWVDLQGAALTEVQAFSTAKAPLLKVHAIDVIRPRQFAIHQHTVYDYAAMLEPKQQPFLIPLEVIFRFGMRSEGSLKTRMEKDPGYATELGLSEAPKPDTWFERPVIEFFTKLEPKDRFLPLQEAFVISGLTPVQFETLYDTALLAALWLYDAFAQKEIELWDGKFEFAWGPEGLMLVDSIGPDELRLLYQGVHLSKEVLRQFYRGTDWELAVQKAKVLSLSQPGMDWRHLCRVELGQSPPPLGSEEKRVADNLYGALVNSFLEQPAVETTMSLAEVVAALQQKQPVGV